jgi:TM2 domain-containing membrane protein YozV
LTSIKHGNHGAKRTEIAILASFIFPGLGQLYNGQNNKAISFAIVGALLLVLTIFLVGFVIYPLFWMYGIYDAFDSDKKLKLEAYAIQ